MVRKEKVVLKAFKGYIHGEDLHSAFNSGYEKLKKEKGYKWLSDNRGLPVYKEEDVTWINEDWFPRILKAGWKYWALIEPKSAIGEMVMKKFQFYSDKGVKIQVFNSIEDGLEWLKTCK